jgi:hypothetical protein
MTFSTTADARLAAKALRENWPMEPQDRASAIACLRTVVDDPKSRPQLLAVAQRALASVGDEIPATQHPSETST